jgi:oligopeptide transport system permease protein
LGPALFFISLLTFGLMHATPGGPYQRTTDLPQEAAQNLNRHYGLDQPLWEQYRRFAWNALRGDLGVSLRVQRNVPVSEMIGERLRPTFALALIAFTLATLIGISLGVGSALNRNRLPDYLGVTVSTAGAALPAFVVGVLLIYVFATLLHWFPTQGWSVRSGLVPGWLPPFEQMVLPVITLSLLPMAYLSRITRAGVLDVLHQDYMRTARAKGLPTLHLVWYHALRNAAIPIISIMGPVAGALFTGSFVVENVFGVPGVGTLFVRAVAARDYNLIMGMTLFYATVALLLQLFVDIAYAFVDPRVRYR